MTRRRETREQLRAPRHADDPPDERGQQRARELGEGELCGDEVGGGFVGEEQV